MELTLTNLIEVVLLQALFLGLHHFYLSKFVDFQFSRYYLLLTLTAATVFPFLDVEFIGALSSIPSYYLPEIEFNSVARMMVPTQDFTLGQALKFIYMVGCIVVGARLLYGLISIMNIIFNSPLKKADKYYVVQTDRVAISSFGPLLFWNNQATLSPQESKLIKQHEITHIRECHSLDVMLIEIATIVFWFNPFVYLYRAAISQNHEFIADRSGAENQKKTYATLLLKATLSAPELTIASHFTQINIKRRIMELSKSNNRSNRPVHYFATLAITILAVLVLSFNSKTYAQNNEQDQVYEKVDEFPQYIGGMAALGARLQEVLDYPKEERKKGVQGKVFVAFVVTKTGKVTDVSVDKGLSNLCDQAAVTAVSKLPDWQPGVHEGNPVNVRVVLPINFALDDVNKGQ